MKTLTISNQKGGVGKSTISTHLAMQANSMGLKTLLIDFDVQGNATKFIANRFSDSDFFSESNTYDLFSISSPKIADKTNFHLCGGTPDLVNIDQNNLSLWLSNFEEISKHFDICIIDTPPTIGLPQIAPMLVCDCVVSPIELSAFSIDGAANMLTTLNNIQSSHNPNLKFLGLLPSRFNKSNNRAKTIHKDLVSTYSEFMYRNDMVVPERQAFADSSYLSLPIWEIKDHVAPKVSRLVRPVFLDIINQVMNK